MSIRPDDLGGRDFEPDPTDPGSIATDPINAERLRKAEKHAMACDLAMHRMEARVEELEREREATFAHNEKRRSELRERIAELERERDTADWAMVKHAKMRAEAEACAEELEQLIASVHSLLWGMWSDNRSWNERHNEARRLIEAKMRKEG